MWCMTAPVRKRAKHSVPRGLLLWAQKANGRSAQMHHRSFFTTVPMHLGRFIKYLCNATRCAPVSMHACMGTASRALILVVGGQRLGMHTRTGRRDG